MRFRKLRIAWSVFCGIACVLLIVLWVRSYSRFDIVELGGSPVFFAHSGYGCLDCGFARSGRNPRIWGSIHLKNAPGEVAEDIKKVITSSQYEVRSVFAGYAITLPYYFLLPVLAAAAAAPSIPRRAHFSLRTLLIATTLVAVVLGLVVWMSQAG
jgi:hypothetical protein